MELMELLKTRRTYRRFDQKKSIPDDVVEDIVQAQQYASCGNNRQPLRYIVVRDYDMKEAVFGITRWAASLPPEQGQPKDGEHPAMFVVVLEDNELRNAVTGVDAGLAISNMTLAAWNHGVGSCIIANVKKPELKEMLSIGDEYTVNSVVAFGYPTHESNIVEVNDGDKLSYYLDENRNYVVPRKRIEDVVTFI